MVVWKIRNYSNQLYLSLLGPLTNHFMWDEEGTTWSSYNEVKDFIDQKTIENAELVQYKVTEISSSKIVKEQQK